MQHSHQVLNQFLFFRWFAYSFLVFLLPFQLNQFLFFFSSFLFVCSILLSSSSVSSSSLESSYSSAIFACLFGLPTGHSSVAQASALASTSSQLTGSVTDSQHCLVTSLLNPTPHWHLTLVPLHCFFLFFFFSFK
jgi:cellulose synthase/poly-beta-1,6-N-acetylglucosamine synthase-like glycosyltransferase